MHEVNNEDCGVPRCEGYWEHTAAAAGPCCMPGGAELGKMLSAEAGDCKETDGDNGGGVATPLRSK